MGSGFLRHPRADGDPGNDITPMDERFDDVDKQIRDMQEQINQVGVVVIKNHEKRIVVVEHKLGLAE